MATAPVDTNYQLKPGETISAYNARIAAYNSGQASTPPTVNPNPPLGTNTTAPSSANSDFVTQLQNQLLGQSSIISSSNSNLENSINTAISGVNTANTDSNQAVTQNYNQQEALAQKTGTDNLTSAQEAQQGFATNTTLLQHIQDTTTKNVNDLESQKQQLILQGNAAAATQISSMQMQAIQYQQQAQQQTFSNLLSMANFGLQNQQQQQAAAQFQQTFNQNQGQQDFAQQQAISSIALQYGLQVKPGDTLASITTAAMPYASKAEQLQLAQIQSQISANNAQAAKALSDISSSSSAVDIASAATAYNQLGGAGGQGGNILSGIKDVNTQSAIVALAGKQKATQQVNLYLQNGLSKSAAQNTVLSNTALSPSDMSDQLDAINSVYANTPVPVAGTPTKFSAPGVLPAGGLSSLPAPAPLTAAQKASASATLDKILKSTSLGFGKK